jgi:beta-barrel assembly-enhancing protease
MKCSTLFAVSLRTRTAILLLVPALSWLGSCAVNPVTGKKELSLTSADKEVAIGSEQYRPAQQSQGGSYDLDPALTAYVNRVGQKLAAVSDRPELPYEFVVLNNDVANAWALPGGKIAVNRGLLTRLNAESELAAVLGHEIVHAAARHGAKQMDKQLIIGGGVALLGVGLAQHDQRDLVLGGAALGSQLIMSHYGRDQELESDHYGIKYMVKAGYDPQGAVEIQRMFLAMSNGGDANVFSQMFASHPPSQARIDANIATISAMGAKGGFVGRDEYLKQVAVIKRDAPAYNAYDQGVAAASKKQWQQALGLADQAIAKQSKESLFYGLKGVALAQLGDNQKALASYDQAISLNPRYYANYLQRGLLLQKMGDASRAKTDLAASERLLPTAVASLAQGEMALAAGDTRIAYQHFGRAQESQGPAGNAARAQLLKLDLVRAPHKYVQAGLAMDDKGRVVVEVINLAPSAIKNVVVNVISANGQSLPVNLKGPLAPGQRSRVTTALAATAANFNSLQVAVVRAQPQ